MNELIPINTDGGKLTVSARALHDFLEVGTDFSHWFPRMCEYGFSEGTDFNPVKNDRVQTEGGRTVTRTVDDAQLTIDMAKELCMIQRSDQGKRARQYFLQLEKDWNSPEKTMARALQFANDTITHLTAHIEADAPKVLFADAVSTSGSTILIGELAKLIKQNGVDIGQNRLFEFLRQHGYLISRSGSDYNMPTQRSMERGWFRVKERTITDPNGSISVKKTTLVTGKGQQYFVNLFLKQAETWDERSLVL